MFPNEEEIIKYIGESKVPVTYTSLAQQFKLRKATISDLVNSLAQDNKVKIIKVGTAKVVQIR